MKIDVECAERDMLAGSKQLLIEHHPILILEIHGAENVFHVQQYLGGLNYSLEILHDSHASPVRCTIIAKPKGQYD